MLPNYANFKQWASTAILAGHVGTHKNPRDPRRLSDFQDFQKPCFLEMHPLYTPHMWATLSTDAPDHRIPSDVRIEKSAFPLIEHCLICIKTLA